MNWQLVVRINEKGNYNYKYTDSSSILLASGVGKILNYGGTHVWSRNLGNGDKKLEASLGYMRFPSLWAEHSSAHLESPQMKQKIKLSYEKGNWSF